jgi:hypothetical protein
MNTPSAGTIYYTLDGTDPRLSGGALSPTALTYSTGTAPQITGNTFVRSRTRNGSEWSGMVEAFFHLSGQPILPPSDLAISEVHFNPAGTSESTEFIELVNTGSRPLNLMGSQFTMGVEFTFPVLRDTVLTPGQRIVLANSLYDMNATYGLDVPVAGLYKNQLSNSGELLRFEDSTATLLEEFTFLDTPPWPTTPDGTGPSLTVIDPTGSTDLNDGLSWRSSTIIGGTPGWDDSVSFTGDPTGDDDQNGLNNLTDHAFGNNGTRPYSQTEAWLGTYDDGSGPEQHLTLRYRANLTDPSLVFGTQLSNDLTVWEAGPAFTEVVERLDNGDGTVTVTARAVQPTSAGELQQYIRLTISRP